jgi:hypothetical protein
MIQSMLSFAAVGALVVGILAYIFKVPRSSMPAYLATGAAIGVAVFAALVFWLMSVLA